MNAGANARHRGAAQVRGQAAAARSGRTREDIARAAATDGFRGFAPCAGYGCQVLIDPQHRLVGRTMPQQLCWECRKKNGT
jgi:hypothetical protein